MLQHLWPTQDHNLRFVEFMLRVARAGELIKVYIYIYELA